VAIPGRDTPGPDASSPPSGTAGADRDQPRAPAEQDTPPEGSAAPRAHRLLREAIERAEQAKAGEHRRGVRVDKYFGSKLPPVCARLGCYVTDDGKRFYCINPACQKHKRRETKHTRLGRPVKEQVVYFKCPRCDSRTIEMHLLANRYLCRTCRYNWER
jgi:predicted RNA-binding Zn-ribbon protein involved in translation (DUF1610 family)